MQERSNSSALAMDLRLSRTILSIKGYHLGAHLAKKNWFDFKSYQYMFAHIFFSKGLITVIKALIQLHVYFFWFLNISSLHKSQKAVMNTYMMCDAW